MRQRERRLSDRGPEEHIARTQGIADAKPRKPSAYKRVASRFLESTRVTYQIGLHWLSQAEPISNRPTGLIQEMNNLPVVLFRETCATVSPDSASCTRKSNRT